MSVPSVLTGILSLGPAYGLQLHAELGSRLTHRATTNVGQIYSTLERLVRDGFVTRAGETSDGLPLYELSQQGRASVQKWLSGDWLNAQTSWVDVMDLLLLSATLPNQSISPICDRIEDVFSNSPPANDSLGLMAQFNFSRAVLNTVTRVRELSAQGDLPKAQLSTTRPVRGRRPSLEKSLP